MPFSMALFETKVKATFENNGRHSMHELILFRDSLPLNLKKFWFI